MLLAFRISVSAPNPRPNRLGLGRGCKFDEESFLLVIEHLLQGGLDQILGWEVNAQGINILLLLIELKMKMRPGGSTGRPNIANDLALYYGHAITNSLG